MCIFLYKIKTRASSNYTAYNAEWQGKGFMEGSIFLEQNEEKEVSGHFDVRVKNGQGSEVSLPASEYHT